MSNTDELDGILDLLYQNGASDAINEEHHTYHTKDAKQAIQALIVKECTKARIEQVMRDLVTMVRDFDMADEQAMEWRDDRIKELSNKEVV